MKKILSTAYSDGAFNFAALALRLCFGLLLILDHGFAKLTHFSAMQSSFADPMHIGHRWSLVLVVFAEVFCSLLLILGLFTRLAALVLVIEMAVAALIIHKGQPLMIHEAAITYLTAFFAILLVGPGRISIDASMGR